MMFLLLFLGGCASTPLPQGPRDALLVVPCEIADFKNDRWIVKEAAAVIRNLDTGKEYLAELSSDQDYLAVSLPSGKYILGKVLLSRAERGAGKLEKTEEILTPVAFFLEKNVVYFARYTLHLEIEEEVGLRISLNRSSGKARSIYEELRKEYFWAAWEVSPLIGLSDSKGD